MSAPGPSAPGPRAARTAASHRRLRTGLLLAIGLLYALSIPWYREPGARPGLVGGLPDWVAVALLCYAGAALLNALAWWVADLPEDPAPLAAEAGEPPEAPGPPRGPGPEGA